MEQTLPKLKTNLDTNLLKLVAVVCMLLDHFGGTFFEQIPAFRWAGRLAFPLFCYCMTVGMLYTHDIKRYLPFCIRLRLYYSYSDIHQKM